ncbi:hypothetical protein ALNOE001_01600 [Candidatus Methanobinarius endosymbioticus]|uniref:Right handed beta helix domain-containing protein n=1 Tax=Candidatus Methanobinarius endosymbioticus TaxID=2006182 RepID=A0A366ME98_9EURY|nr:hypothetical protein ALNOE001_01600 [Candidatus Methanobinarius endosymbioticus]
MKNDGTKSLFVFNSNSNGGSISGLNLGKSSNGITLQGVTNFTIRDLLIENASGEGISIISSNYIDLINNTIQYNNS